MNIRTAVIPVAGAGSREFPVTTAIEKCMLPVYAGADSRPLVEYMVEECVKAGISRIIFVTTERGRQQLSDYFAPDIPPTLRVQLLSLGKTEIIEAELARRQAYGVQFEYIIQPADKYGTVIPLYLARNMLHDEERFAYYGGDDFVYHPDGTSELAQAVNEWDQAGTDHVIFGLPIAREAATKYGNLQIDNPGRLREFVEKPPLEQVQAQPMISISRYVLGSSIWDHVDAEMKQDRGTGEHHFGFTISAALASGQSFWVHRVTGKYLDGGSFEGLLEASTYISEHPRMA